MSPPELPVEQLRAATSGRKPAAGAPGCTTIAFTLQVTQPSDGTRPAGSQRIWLYLAAILLASLLVKGYFAAVTADISLVWDEAKYYGVALLLFENDLDWRVFPGAQMTPGYPYFLAAVMELTGPHPLGPKLGQILASVLSAAMLFGLVRRVFDERVALVATGIFSFLPELVGLSHLLWSETIFIAFMIPALWLTFSFHRTGNPWAALASGLVWGVATLVRSVSQG